MNASIVCIGSELTSGRVVNTNASRLASVLTSLGFSVKRCVVVGDERQDLVSELRQAFEASGVLIITGGLGPTADDITREAMAEAAGLQLVEEGKALVKIRKRFADRGIEMPLSNEKQALFPEGSKPIENPIGTADGWEMEAGNARVFVLPGVPEEMESMLPQVVEALREADSSAGVERKLRLFGLSESAVDEKLHGLIGTGQNPEVGLMAEGGIISVRILARGDDLGEADTLADDAEEEIRGLLRDHIFGVGDEGLEHAVARELERTGKTLAVAESCTGGLICDMLTNVPGISRHFLEGVVAYSNEAKKDLLEVGGELIRKHGAISEPVALAMALGVRKRSGSDVAVSVTGIAGPGGGTPEKPIGLCYIAVVSKEAGRCHQYNFGKGRPRVKHRAAKTALYLLWKLLKAS